MQTCVWRSSVTAPACSDLAPRARAATPRTSDYPVCRRTLIAELLETGTPVVVVVVSGRPYALGEVHGRTAGLVQAFMPGEEGGPAIAGVLSGRVQPGGKLPVQIPRNAGGQPSTYLQPPLGGAESAGISTLDATPLFAFGHGRSYTTFAVDSLWVSDAEIATDGELTVSVRLTNTGSRAGDEVVQLYLHDVVAQVARPLKQLVGFARVQLEPGEGADVRFSVHADRTAYTVPQLRRIVEPGDIEALVGTSATDLPCRASFRITGPVRVVGHDRRLVTPVDVRRTGSAPRRQGRGWPSCRPSRAGPPWPPSQPRPACPWRPSPRCSTGAATSHPPRARGSRTCCGSTTTPHRRRRGRRRQATDGRAVLQFDVELPTRPRSCKASWTPGPRLGVAVVVTVGRAGQRN